MNRLQQLQEAARKRYGHLTAQQRELPAISASQGNMILENALRPIEILSTLKFIRPVLAISYRPDLPASTSKAGAWKSFETASEANKWLLSRSGGGAAVYTGTAIYWNMQQVLAAWQDPGTPGTLRLALIRYLVWRQSLERW